MSIWTGTPGQDDLKGLTILGADKLELDDSTNQIVLDADGTNKGTVTMAALTAARTWTLPDATDTLVGKATTDTLTNKTLTAPVLSGTATGTYTLGGTPTIASPTLSGTVAGTYTLGGTPTLSGAAVSGAAPATPTANILYTDSVVKAWVRITGGATPAIGDDLNVSSLTDGGVGDITITWATAFANAVYAVAGMCANAMYLTHDQDSAQAVGSFRIQVITDAGAVADSDHIFVMAIGDQ